MVENRLQRTLVAKISTIEVPEKGDFFSLAHTLSDDCLCSVREARQSYSQPPPLMKRSSRIHARYHFTAPTLLAAASLAANGQSHLSKLPRAVARFRKDRP